VLRQSVLVGAGGFVGSCLRYWAGLAGARLAGAPTPWATAFVNVTGCLAIGFLAARVLSPELRAFCLVGVLGGYTTFSTFGFETWSLLEQGRTGQALASVLVQVGLGLAAVAAGLALGRGTA
jgi:CrcB protein